MFIFPGFAGDQRHVQLGSGPGNLFKQQDRPCQFEAVPNAPDVKPAWLFDALIADLDGDLSLDQVGVSRGTTASLEQGMRYFRLELPGAAEASDFQFRIAGGANLSVRPAVGSMGWLKPEGSSVYLGKSGAAPEASQFALDPENPELLGPYDAAGRDHGVFIGYDPGTEIWSVLVKKSHPQNVTIDARAEGGVEVLGAPSIRSSPPLTGKAVAYVQGAEGWVNAPTTMGLDEVDQSCVSVVAADLDNDMDMDLFMACGDTARNQDNVLLVNDGGRYVHTVTDVKPEQTGLVDAVSTGDFDRDGFPDLLITNGASLDSDRSGHGYTQLWRNRGNGNKWANGSVERFPGPAINAEADLTQGSGTIVSAPLLLTGKQVASRGENVHFLLLCATVMDCDVRGWDIDGERLDTTRRSLDYVFNTAGAKTVAATVNLASGKALRIATEITIPP